MEVIIKKEELFNGIKIVERATVMKGLQPVLANILFEALSSSQIKLTATDLDMTVVAIIEAQIKKGESEKITLPAKTLSEIVSRLPEGLITIKKEEGENKVNIKSKNTKYEIIGISASEFPEVQTKFENDEEKEVEVELKPFIKALKKAGFAAAGYETNNLLSGVVCNITEGKIEIASTDGNRLARIREITKNKETLGGEEQLILPSKTVQEFIKMSSFIEEERVKIKKDKTKIIIKSENTRIISRLMEGQYPKYNQLIPTECPKEAIVDISQLISSLERVAIMVNEKTSIVKLSFADNTMKLNADTPDAGASEDEIEARYMEEPINIAFNYRYVLDCLKNMESKEVKIGLNTGLSATIFKPNNEEDFVCLVMPVQIRN